MEREGKRGGGREEREGKRGGGREEREGKRGGEEYSSHLVSFNFSDSLRMKKLCLLHCRSSSVVPHEVFDMNFATN